MSRHIKKFIAQFYDKIFASLWLESLLFSVLIGIGFRSWVVSGLMFLGLTLLIHQPKGTVYTVVALSLMWGYIAASIGYSFGGWLWAAVLGSLGLIQGVRIHWRKLGLSWVDLDYGVKNVIDFRGHWDLRRQNLN